ncbi:MAG TPA: transglutaminase family protein [Polyangiaceae bacterium]|jgi:transglutaminase-like putative cysteine protease|nr:transglutaminase family protein [Polyangiaceae bacterium]
MLYEIQHRTELNYSTPISESVMEVRLTPRSDPNQTLRRFHIVVGPDSRVSNHTDWQGNTVHQFSVVSFHDRVVIQSNSTVATHPQRLDLAAVADPMRAAKTSHRLLDFLSFGGPVQRDPRIVALAERIKLHDCVRAVDAVLRVQEAVRDALTYQKGVTNSLTTVAEALDQGAGVCQDFTHIALAMLRLIGVPCRYVSGYLHRSDLPEVETHAWGEAFIPSIGWLAFDPTHGELVSEGHIAVATGRSYADVPPNRGVYRGEAEERIAVAVTISSVEGPQGASSFVMPFHIPSYTDPPNGALASSAYQLEQQQQQQQQDRNKAQVQQQRQQQQ